MSRRCVQSYLSVVLLLYKKSLIVSTMTTANPITLVNESTGGLLAFEFAYENYTCEINQTLVTYSNTTGDVVSSNSTVTTGICTRPRFYNLWFGRIEMGFVVFYMLLIAVFMRACLQKRKRAERRRMKSIQVTKNLRVPSKYRLDPLCLTSLAAKLWLGPNQVTNFADPGFIFFEKQNEKTSVSSSQAPRSPSVHNDLELVLRGVKYNEQRATTLKDVTGARLVNTRNCVLQSMAYLQNYVKQEKPAVYQKVLDLVKGRKSIMGLNNSDNTNEKGGNSSIPESVLANDYQGFIRALESVCGSSSPTFAHGKIEEKSFDKVIEEGMARTDSTVDGTELFSKYLHYYEITRYGNSVKLEPKEFRRFLRLFDRLLCLVREK